jgi:hypothetical protein
MMSKMDPEIDSGLCLFQIRLDLSNFRSMKSKKKNLKIESTP